LSNLVPTLAEFQAAYPVFTDAGLPVEAQLAISARLLDKVSWGEWYSDGILLDAAHNLALTQIALTPKGAFEAAAGPLNSASAGGMSASFTQAQFSSKSIREQFYSKTIYGQQLLRLWNCVIPPVDI
jgi:hypothetical protein